MQKKKGNLVLGIYESFQLLSTPLINVPAGVKQLKLLHTSVNMFEFQLESCQLTFLKLDNLFQFFSLFAFNFLLIFFCIFILLLLLFVNLKHILSVHSS